MRQLPIQDESWTEAEAACLVRTFGGVRRHRRTPTDESARSLADAIRTTLTRTVEGEVIPRLVMARRLQATASTLYQTDVPSPDKVEHLVDVALHGTQAALTAHVEALRNGGMSIECLFLDLLTPAARRLGVLWEEDLCDFSHVTLGVLRLGDVVRLLSRGVAGDEERCLNGPSALLAQMPGEQHGLGLAMIVQFFRSAGWRVRQAPAPTSTELVDLVRHQWYGVVGISLACDDRLDCLASDIRAIRKASRNRAVGIMVGGPPFIARPDLASKVGADTTAIDGRQAVQQAQSLVSLMALSQ